MKRVSIHKFVVVCTFAILCVAFCMLYQGLTDTNSNIAENMIYALSIYGWVQFIFCLVTWKKITGYYVSLYSIFLIFAYLFSFGQCLMWAFGIHTVDEIGRRMLYNFGVPTPIAIIETQLLTLIGLIAFHAGAIVSYNRSNIVIEQGLERGPEEADYQNRVLFQVCKISCIISTPLMFYSIVRSIAINSIYGYGAVLYNADVVASQSNIVMLLRLMYFPSIVGLLISSKYDNRVVRISYGNFAIFMILGLFAGDRGEWLFPLCLLIWMHHKYRSKIRLKSIIRYLVFGLVLVIISVAIRNSRSTGITIEGLTDAIFSEKNPIISAVFELGGSMKPLLIVSQYGWGSYPYGNSYLLAFFGMVTERIIKLVIPDYISMSAWFSSSLLGISYGAGFSFVAEAFMNFGPYGSIITMFLIGLLFSKVMFSIENTRYSEYPLKVFFGIATAYCMLHAIRNTMLVALKMWVFSTVIIVFAYYIYSSVLKHREVRHIDRRA